MSENTSSAEKPLVKEKKTLDYRIALAIMIVMIVCALLNGASKAWKKNRSSVDAAYVVLEENLQQRVETAYNLLTVAGRYLASDDSLIAAVKSDLKTMESAGASADMETRVKAGYSFPTDAQSLLKALSGNQAVQNDSRDKMYVELMLPQAVEQCSGTAAMESYRSASQSYNDGLRSFSGFLARLTGVSFAPTLETVSSSQSAAAE